MVAFFLALAVIYSLGRLPVYPLYVCKKNKVWFERNEGGLHERIWFAKAGKGGDIDRGISPEPRFHLKNGSYSFTLSFFDPRGMSLKEAQEVGRETSVFKDMGGQFGAQIWRMAHEAKVGDYIFLESENHHLHAVGFISGEYDFLEQQDQLDRTASQGCHNIPVHWIEIPKGRDAIQLGRLDNAVFRNVVDKEELVSLLLDLTSDITQAAWGKLKKDISTSTIPDSVQMPRSEPQLSAGDIKLSVPGAAKSPATQKSKEVGPKPAKSKVSASVVDNSIGEEAATVAESSTAAIKPQGVPAVPEEVSFNVSRNGQVFVELTEKGMLNALEVGLVRPNDFYWTNGMSGWELVSGRFKVPLVPLPQPLASPPKSHSGKVLDFNVATSTGLILGDNGVRYNFRGTEWRSAVSLPHIGVQVNFVVLANEATSIYVVAPAAAKLVSPGSLKSDYKDLGYYRSSDEKLVGGVCAGLAHKWNRSALILRLVFLIFYPLLLVYVIMWLALPERMTKR
jgi:phage shock protein PspC (stress-responsive transcriptional regulator)